MRRLAGALAIIVLAVAGLFGLLAFFNSRDDSTTGGRTGAPAPGVAAPAAGGALLKGGNVVLAFSDPTFASRLKALAGSLGAPDTPELRAAGQAVVLRPDPKAGGVIARAYRHTLTVNTPADPRLQDFIERWLGRVASR